MQASLSSKGPQKKTVKPDVSGRQGAALANLTDGKVHLNVGVCSVFPKNEQDNMGSSLKGCKHSLGAKFDKKR